MQTHTYPREQVVEIIGSVINKMSTSKKPVNGELDNELHSLYDAIHTLRLELNALYPAEIAASFLPAATGELDAVVAATEAATNTILGACERIHGLTGAQDDALSAKIAPEITRIIEACTFQDLTGQRIANTIKSLHKINDRTVSLLNVLEQRFAAIVPLEGPTDLRSEDQKLLNGPQLPGAGISQDDIDRLLAEFG